MYLLSSFAKCKAFVKDILRQYYAKCVTTKFSQQHKYLAKHTVLEKDSSELKVLAITINSKVKQAFECSFKNNHHHQHTV